MGLLFTVTACAAFLASVAATLAVRKLAFAWGAVDMPKPGRKIHAKPTALLGGLGIYGSIVIVLIALLVGDVLPSGSISAKHIVGLLAGGFWLVIGGALDDKFNLKPKQQIIWPVLATLSIIGSGIGIESISNPLGGQWFLHQVDIPLLWIKGLPYKITLLSDVFTFFWLMGVMYATKFFDGLDGLVSGITVIGALVVFAVSLSSKINQPETALLALVIAAVFAGFLVFNFNPASIFLGESGSTLAGFCLAVLSIIAESKVVTTLVVMSLPVLDLIWVMVRRIFIDRVSPSQADRKHIHHRLLDSGFSQRRAVLLLYLWAVVCGLFALAYQEQGQWYVLFAAMLAVLGLAFYLVRYSKRV